MRIEHHVFACFSQNQSKPETLILCRNFINLQSMLLEEGITLEQVFKIDKIYLQC